MKFTLGWLKDHLDTNASLDEISTTLTAIGLEVESITDLSAQLAPFTVAKIIHAEKHPQADKLRICKVQTTPDNSSGESQIVCGAPNARAGLYVVLAKEGSTIPANGMVIKKTRIRDVESNGMLCSADELGITGDSEGIIELPDTCMIGMPAIDALGLNDPVIEIAITPNRADCLGVYGIARDLAATGLGTLKNIPNASFNTSFESPIAVTITSDHCQQFMGVYIKGVTNGKSPDRISKRLNAIGQKTISTLVDITNYITIDLGRPLHVYDAQKLNGNLTVRDAKSGETFKALNGKTYQLAEGMCVIADANGPQALGGIIGGEATGCTMDTTDVFVEVALFDPVHIASNGRKLSIDSDARYRFERGVDPEFLHEGMQQAVSMITQLCGGTCSNMVVAGNVSSASRQLSLSYDRIENFGGVTLPKSAVESILTRLGCKCEASADGYKVTIPSWRADIEGEADLVEEVLRIHGYDHIPTTPLPKLETISKPALDKAQKQMHLAKRHLASRGFYEAVTWSFLPSAHAKLFGADNDSLTLINPISADLDTMRPSLLPNLLQAAHDNAARGFHNINLCEVGLQFIDITPQGQQRVAAAIRTGTQSLNSYDAQLFTHKERSVDVFDIKADAISALEILGIQKIDITRSAPDWYHPGRSGALTLGGKIILGYFGEIHPAILKHFDIEDRVCGFELLLDALPAPRNKTKSRPTLKTSDYQAVERDFAFIVDHDTTVATIVQSIAKAEKQLITDIKIFDVYAGKGVDEGKKSVAVKVILQSMERTLSESDINTVSSAIITAASKGFGGTLRQ